MVYKLNESAVVFYFSNDNVIVMTFALIKSPRFSNALAYV